MQRRATVSVNIITYNRRDLLERCLRSVFEQTFTDFEIIIIDDGSADETSAFIESLSNSSIAYESVPHTGSIPRLRNLALQKSTGEYIAFLDSDDWWERTKLERQLSAMKNSRAALSFTNALVVNQDEKQTAPFLRREHAYYMGSIIPRLFTDWFVLTPTVMFRRQLLEVAGVFNEALTSAADPEFILRLLRAGQHDVLFEPLVTVHEHANQHSTHNDITAYTEMIGIAREYRRQKLISREQFHRSTSVLQYRLGIIYERLHDYAQARDAFALSLVHNPLNLRSMIKWIRN